MPQRAHILAVADVLCRMREDRDCMPQRAYTSIYVKNEKGPGEPATEGACPSGRGLSVQDERRPGLHATKGVYLNLCQK